MTKKAGYTILQDEIYRFATERDYGICLGRHPSKKCPAPFVTWEFSIDHITGEVDRYWGHYFETEEAARCDYHRRLAAYYEMPYTCR